MVDSKMSNCSSGSSLVICPRGGLLSFLRLLSSNLVSVLELMHYKKVIMYWPYIEVVESPIISFWIFLYREFSTFWLGPAHAPMTYAGAYVNWFKTVHSCGSHMKIPSTTLVRYLDPLAGWNFPAHSFNLCGLCWLKSIMLHKSLPKCSFHNKCSTDSPV
jgi:hypothetical protein